MGLSEHQRGLEMLVSESATMRKMCSKRVKQTKVGFFFFFTFIFKIKPLICEPTRSLNATRCAAVFCPALITGFMRMSVCDRPVDANRC